MSRRFPAPWHLIDTPGGWQVRDNSGFVIVNIYGEDRVRGANDHGMSKDEARRIAVNIAKLPELLGAGRA